MKNNPKISAMRIASEISIAPRNVEANIKKLKLLGLIERDGPAFGGRWVVK
jgi:ATP-dependent DNA helicase RecG